MKADAVWKSRSKAVSSSENHRLVVGSTIAMGVRREQGFTGMRQTEIRFKPTNLMNRKISLPSASSALKMKHVHPEWRGKRATYN